MVGDPKMGRKAVLIESRLGAVFYSFVLVFLLLFIIIFIEKGFNEIHLTD